MMVANCFPTDGGGYAVALRAYFDGSVQNGVFSVAGFAFGLDQAKKASREWNKLHNGRVLHMTDLHNRKRDFAGLSPEEGGRLLTESVSIINRFFRFGAAASCDISEIGHHFPIPRTGHVIRDALAGGISSPYAWCCHTVMHHIGSLVLDTGGGPNDVTYIFETGDHGQGAVKEYVRYVEDSNAPGFRNLYAMNGAQFASKDGLEVLLQSGDIFSWEWAKHILRKRDGLHTRPSLDAIFGGLQEAPNKYGMTSRSTKPWRVIASHYEGDSWGRGFAELIEQVKTP